MAVTITPLGFKKPDGAELVRGGDNHISDNAQKAEDLIAAAQATAANHGARITNIETAASPGGGLLVGDPNDPGFFLIGGAP